MNSTKKAIAGIALWFAVILVMGLFAFREVARLAVNLWHHSHLWVWIPLGIILVPVSLWAIGFLAGFLRALITGKK
ncbi:MAG TPA: hypothetical protein VKV04_17000 [Verrucomicrobiae bacterium]|nr:hypothetical protein [Verrucomicrobiae bacterium]